MSSKRNTVFIGTPEFAVPALLALVESGIWHVAAVITQPDKPAGRGHKLTPPAIKTIAEGLGIPVFQPKSLKSLTLDSSVQNASTKAAISGSDELAPLCEALNNIPDLEVIVTVAYGKIIPTALLNLAPRGIVNIHPSILPRWRGAAPLQHTIFSGDKECGVCLMKAEEGLDTGPVFVTEKYPLSPLTTLGELHDDLSRKGAALLLRHLESIAQGCLNGRPQDNEHSTYADKWTIDDALIDWREASDTCLRRILASSPFPGARSNCRNKITSVTESVKIYRAHPEPTSAPEQMQPGEILSLSSAPLCILCGDGKLLSIDEAQLPGKKRLPIRELLKGFSLEDKFFEKLIHNNEQGTS